METVAIMTDEELFAPLPDYVSAIADALNGTDAIAEDNKFIAILERFSIPEQDTLLEKYVAYRNIGFTADEIIEMYLGG